MTRAALLAGTALGLMLAHPDYSWAQAIETSGVSSITGTTRITDTIEDAEEEAEEEFERSQDEARFGTASVPPGFRGSLFASGTLDTGGDEDSIDASLGGRFTLGQGLLSHTLGIAAIYGEADGDRDDNQIFAIYDANYDLTDRFYAFGLARAVYDEFDAVEQDYFVGFGPGYRIFNEPGLAWRIQAGPGWRYQVFDEEDGAGSDDTESEIAGIVSSRFFYEINEQMFLTDDTDVLFSNSSTSVTNDFGFNLRVQGPFSLRAGLLTDWDSESNDDFDHTLTAALVYSITP